MRLIFFDTEFTSLGDDSRLIAIGMVDETGEKTFYAELSDTWVDTDASDFTRLVVLPLLGDPSARVSMSVLVGKLSSWIEAFNEPVQLATDSLMWDWKWVVEFFGEPGGKRWPVNLAMQPFLMTMNYIKNYDRFLEVLDDSLLKGHFPPHHALNDAKAYRLAWLSSER